VPALTDRPMRADARRNRERVLDAAMAAFAHQGLRAQVEDIALRAGVGVGTVCRNFPTKELLVEAVLSRVYGSLLDDARQALADPDPTQGFLALVDAVVEFQARHRVLAEEMAELVELPDGAVPRRDALRDATAEILARAQRAGAIREDIGPADMAMLLAGMAQAASVTGDQGPILRRRYVAIILDGLRPTGASPLPGRPLGLAHLTRQDRRAH